MAASSNKSVGDVGRQASPNPVSPVVRGCGGKARLGALLETRDILGSLCSSLSAFPRAASSSSSLLPDPSNERADSVVRRTGQVLGSSSQSSPSLRPPREGSAFENVSGSGCSSDTASFVGREGWKIVGVVHYAGRETAVLVVSSSSTTSSSASPPVGVRIHAVTTRAAFKRELIANGLTKKTMPWIMATPMSDPTTMHSPLPVATSASSCQRAGGGGGGGLFCGWDSHIRECDLRVAVCGASTGPAPDAAIKSGATTDTIRSPAVAAASTEGGIVVTAGLFESVTADTSFSHFFVTLRFPANVAGVNSRAFSSSASPLMPSLVGGMMTTSADAAAASSAAAEGSSPRRAAALWRDTCLVPATRMDRPLRLPTGRRTTGVSAVSLDGPWWGQTQPFILDGHFYTPTNGGRMRLVLVLGNRVQTPAAPSAGSATALTVAGGAGLRTSTTSDSPRMVGPHVPSRFLPVWQLCEQAAHWCRAQRWQPSGRTARSALPRPAPPPPDLLTDSGRRPASILEPPLPAHQLSGGGASKRTSDPAGEATPPSRGSGGEGGTEGSAASLLPSVQWPPTVCCYRLMLADATLETASAVDAADEGALAGSKKGAGMSSSVLPMVIRAGLQKVSDFVRSKVSRFVPGEIKEVSPVFARPLVSDLMGLAAEGVAAASRAAVSVAHTATSASGFASAAGRALMAHRDAAVAAAGQDLEWARASALWYDVDPLSNRFFFIAPYQPVASGTAAASTPTPGAAGGVNGAGEGGGSMGLGAPLAALYCVLMSTKGACTSFTECPIVVDDGLLADAAIISARSGGASGRASQVAGGGRSSLLPMVSSTTSVATLASSSGQGAGTIASRSSTGAMAGFSANDGQAVVRAPLLTRQAPQRRAAFVLGTPEIDPAFKLTSSMGATAVAPALVFAQVHERPSVSSQTGAAPPRAPGHPLHGAGPHVAVLQSCLGNGSCAGHVRVRKLNLPTNSAAFIMFEHLGLIGVLSGSLPLDTMAARHQHHAAVTAAAFAAASAIAKGGGAVEGVQQEAGRRSVSFQLIGSLDATAFASSSQAAAPPMDSLAAVAADDGGGRRPTKGGRSGGPSSSRRKPAEGDEDEDDDEVFTLSLFDTFLTRRRNAFAPSLRRMAHMVLDRGELKKLYRPREATTGREPSGAREGSPAVAATTILSGLGANDSMAYPSVVGGGSVSAVTGSGGGPAAALRFSQLSRFEVCHGVTTTRRTSSPPGRGGAASDGTCDDESGEHSSDGSALGGGTVSNGVTLRTTPMLVRKGGLHRGAVVALGLNWRTLCHLVARLLREKREGEEADAEEALREQEHAIRDMWPSSTTATTPRRRATTTDRAPTVKTPRSSSIVVGNASVAAPSFSSAAAVVPPSPSASMGPPVPTPDTTPVGSVDTPCRIRSPNAANAPPPIDSAPPQALAVRNEAAPSAGDGGGRRDAVLRALKQQVRGSEGAPDEAAAVSDESYDVRRRPSTHTRSSAKVSPIPEVSGADEATPATEFIPLGSAPPRRHDSAPSTAATAVAPPRSAASSAMRLTSVPVPPPSVSPPEWSSVVTPALVILSRCYYDPLDDNDTFATTVTQRQHEENAAGGFAAPVAGRHGQKGGSRSNVGGGVDLSGDQTFEDRRRNSEIQHLVDALLVDILGVSQEEEDDDGTPSTDVSPAAAGAAAGGRSLDSERLLVLRRLAAWTPRVWAQIMVAVAAAWTTRWLTLPNLPPDTTDSTDVSAGSSSDEDDDSHRTTSQNTIAAGYARQRRRRIVRPSRRIVVPNPENFPLWSGVYGKAETGGGDRVSSEQELRTTLTDFYRGMMLPPPGMSGGPSAGTLSDPPHPSRGGGSGERVVVAAPRHSSDLAIPAPPGASSSGGSRSAPLLRTLVALPAAPTPPSSSQRVATYNKDDAYEPRIAFGFGTRLDGASEVSSEWLQRINPPLHQSPDDYVDIRDLGGKWVSFGMSSNPSASVLQQSTLYTAVKSWIGIIERSRCGVSSATLAALQSGGGAGARRHRAGTSSGVTGESSQAVSLEHLNSDIDATASYYVQLLTDDIPFRICNVVLARCGGAPRRAAASSVSAVENNSGGDWMSCEHQDILSGGASPEGTIVRMIEVTVRRAWALLGYDSTSRSTKSSR